MIHKRFRPAIILLLILATIAVAAWPHFTNAPSNPQDAIIVGGHRFTTTIARTPQQQVDGLSGWDHLDSNHSMYFPLDDRHASFWMKGMLIDIDIIWIDNGQIVGIHKNVAAPAPGTPDSTLKSYPSPVSNPDAVLEIAAGRSDELGLKVGDQVETKFQNNGK